MEERPKQKEDKESCCRDWGAVRTPWRLGWSSKVEHRTRQSRRWNISGVGVGTVKSKQKCQSLSHVQHLSTSWTIARQAPLSMGILQARILEWVVILSWEGLPSPGIEPGLLRCKCILYHLSYQGSWRKAIQWVKGQRQTTGNSWRSLWTFFLVLILSETLSQQGALNKFTLTANFR